MALGYHPSEKDIVFPFKVLRSRHKAIASLEADPRYQATIANCNSRKK